MNQKLGFANFNTKCNVIEIICFAPFYSWYINTYNVKSSICNFSITNNYSTVNTRKCNIYKSLEEGIVVCVLFQDLSRTFDWNDFTFLENKLDWYRFRGVALIWFKSFPSRKKHAVKIKDINTGNFILGDSKIA